MPPGLSPSRSSRAWPCSPAATRARKAGDPDRGQGQQGRDHRPPDQPRPLASSAPRVPPEQAASASRAILERLIDQEVTLQKAADQKLDRDPDVVQEIEAARREIISRAYLDKIGAGTPKATPAEVAAYYEAHPALFKERRVYSLQEVNIDASPEQVDELKKTLVSSKTFADFVTYLKANNIRFTGSEAVRAAEQLPLASVDQFAKMKDGQAIFNVRPGGAQVINLAASRPQPVSLQQATPAIEQFLLNERKRKLIADDLQALRSKATIEYMGDFAAGAPPSPFPRCPSRRRGRRYRRRWVPRSRRRRRSTRRSNRTLHPRRAPRRSIVVWGSKSECLGLARRASVTRLNDPVLRDDVPLF